MKAENVFKIAMTYSRVLEFLTSKGWKFQGKDEEMEMDLFRNKRTGKKLFVEDGERAFPGNGKPRDAELAELRKENKNLREERDILRKAVAIFSKPPR